MQIFITIKTLLPTLKFNTSKKKERKTLLQSWTQSILERTNKLYTAFLAIMSGSTTCAGEQPYPHRINHKGSLETDPWHEMQSLYVGLYSGSLSSNFTVIIKDNFGGKEQHPRRKLRKKENILVRRRESKGMKMTPKPTGPNTSGITLSLGSASPQCGLILLANGDLLCMPTVQTPLPHFQGKRSPRVEQDLTLGHSLAMA